MLLRYARLGLSTSPDGALLASTSGMDRDLHLSDLGELGRTWTVGPLPSRAGTTFWIGRRTRGREHGLGGHDRRRRGAHGWPADPGRRPRDRRGGGRRPLRRARGAGRRSRRAAPVHGGSLGRSAHGRSARPARREGVRPRPPAPLGAPGTRALIRRHARLRRAARQPHRRRRPAQRPRARDLHPRRPRTADGRQGDGRLAADERPARPRHARDHGQRPLRQRVLGLSRRPSGRAAHQRSRLRAGRTSRCRAPTGSASAGGSSWRRSPRRARARPASPRSIAADGRCGRSTPGAAAVLAGCSASYVYLHLPGTGVATLDDAHRRPARGAPRVCRDDGRPRG